jgi:hypothetical protein
MPTEKAAYTPPKRQSAMSLKDARERGPLEYVDPEKTYRAVIQLGTRMRWRKFGGGEFTDLKQKQADDPRQQGRQPWEFKYKAAVHETGPIMGDTLNGLISQHNRWLDANVNNQFPLGLLNMQLLVLNHVPTNETAADKPSTLQLDVETIAKISAASAREAVAATIDALTKNKGNEGGK